MLCAHHVSLAALIALPTWQLSGIAKWKFISLSRLFFSIPEDWAKTTKGGSEASYETGKKINKTNIVLCAHHVSLAALIALPTWQLSGIAKWKFISLSLLFFSSPRDQSWHCIPLNYSGVDDADIYVMMTQDGATYTVAVFVINCPKIVKPLCPLYIKHISSSKWMKQAELLKIS